MSDAKLHDEPVHTAHLNGAKADLHRLLAALIKLALSADAPEAATWRGEAVEAQQRVGAQAAALAGVSYDSLWALAIKTAESDSAARRGETVNPMLPTSSPLPLQQLTADPFALDDAVQSIRDVASFG